MRMMNITEMRGKKEEPFWFDKGGLCTEASGMYPQCAPVKRI